MRVKMNQMEKSHKDAMELQQVGNYICTSNMSQSACRKFGEKCTTGVKKKKCYDQSALKNMQSVFTIGLHNYDTVVINIH